MSISRLTRWRARLRQLALDYDQVADEATADTLQRFMLLLRFAVPMHATLAIWFLRYEAPLDQPGLQQWADALGRLHVGLSVALVAYGGIAHYLIGRKSRPAAAARAVQVAICLSYLAFGAWAAILDTAIGNGIATFLVVCMGTATLSLLRPWLSACVYAGALAIFIAGLHGQAIDAALRSSMLIQAISTVLMAQLIAVVMWNQYVAKVLLQRQLQATNTALQSQQKTLESMAERDTLTGLYNRRKFVATTEKELARASRVPADLCLLLIDLDHFKRINDRYGHPAGDAILQHVASLLLSHIRATDTVARLGGEEFIVLMPHTPVEGALALAEKLRQALHDQVLNWQGAPIPVSASIGVCGIAAQQSTTFDAMYSAADQALYAAKHQGRDRVILAATPRLHTAAEATQRRTLERASPPGSHRQQGRQQDQGSPQHHLGAEDAGPKHDC